VLPEQIPPEAFLSDMAEVFTIGMPLNLQVPQGLLGNASNLVRSPPFNGSFPAFEVNLPLPKVQQRPRP
jgi:hypothetical protein